MNWPTKEQIEAIKVQYPEGTRVALMSWGPSEVIDDHKTVPRGTEGTVTMVDGAGSICVDWDNGSSLSVVYGVDHVRRV